MMAAPNRYLLVEDGPEDARVILEALAACEEERARSARALVESEERYRLVARASNDSLWEYDVAADRIWWGEDSLQSLGYRPGEIPSTVAEWEERVHPDDLREFRETFHGAIRRGEDLWTLEYRVRRRDGTYAYVFERGWITPDAEGRPTRMVGALMDLSERRRAEEALRGSEERYRRLVETMAQGVVVFDGTGGFVDANPAAEEMLGLSAGELRGRTSADPGWRAVREDGSPLPPEELPSTVALRTGREVDGRVMGIVNPAEKKRRWLLVHARPQFRPGETVPHQAFTTLTDITSLREAEAAHRKSEVRLALIFETVADAIVITDGDGRITQANRTAEEVLGLSRREIESRSFSDPSWQITAPDGGPFPVDQLPVSRVLATGAPVFGVEHAIELPDGRRAELSINAAPLRGASGATEGVVCSIRDVTEMKRLQRELQQAQRMEAVGRLAGGVAHDFNNVLTAIQSYTHFILDDLSPSDPLRADAEEIRTAAIRAAGLTRQLLAFSRRQVLQPRVLDLGAVVGGMEGMLARLIGEDVELAFSCDPQLGRVQADPGQVEQVVLNLAVNARDAMPDGGHLSLELENDGGPGPESWVVLRVADTGTGIPEDVLPHVFEPFFTTKETGRGTGLGLSTVYGIVAQSGGRIDVRSEPGAGTTFEVRLPRVDLEAEEEAPEPEAAAPAQGETVLLVEDEDAVRALGVRTLRRLGYRVLEARNAGEALLICEGHPGSIDLLLTDVVMPRMSGREMAERLARVRPGLRVLYMSGYTDDAVTHHRVARDGQAFLQKPFDPVTLGARVREVLDHPA